MSSGMYRRDSPLECGVISSRHRFQSILRKWLNSFRQPVECGTVSPNGRFLGAICSTAKRHQTKKWHQFRKPDGDENQLAMLRAFVRCSLEHLAEHN